MQARSLCLCQPVPAQGQQVEAAGAVGSCGNVCLLTTVHSQHGRLWLSQEEHVPLAVTITCPVVPAVLDSSPRYCAVLPVRDGLGHCGHTPVTCVWQTPPGQEQRLIPLWLFQNFCGMRQLNKLLPFSQVCRDAHKGTDKEVQDKNGRNQSAGSSRELRCPTALVASAEHGKC